MGANFKVNNFVTGFDYVAESKEFGNTETIKNNSKLNFTEEHSLSFNTAKDLKFSLIGQNVRGLGNKEKRDEVFLCLLEEGDVIFLQETHTISEHEKIYTDKYPHTFRCGVKARSCREVASSSGTAAAWPCSRKQCFPATP